ncbi:MAG: hypothetical protein HYZ26_07540 [Chloroflexi bacterium]|nr:hypothetical protein [Chloroflexota bacterium]
MKRFRSFLQQLISGGDRPVPAMANLMGALAMTCEEEFACDEVYALLDQVAEAAHRGEDVRVLMPLVQKHLDMCPDCREEFEGLLAMIQS